MTDIRPAKSSSLKVSDSEETRPSLRIMQDDAEPVTSIILSPHPTNRRKTGSDCCGHSYEGLHCDSPRGIFVIFRFWIHIHGINLVVTGEGDGIFTVFFRTVIVWVNHDCDAEYNVDHTIPFEVF